ncbi:AbgT family transporter [Shewanella gaetbuli]
MHSKTVEGSASIFDRIEKWGNKLPHPVSLFFILTVGLLLVSAIGSYLGWSYQLPDQPEQTINNLISEQGLRNWLSGSIQAFISFPPLGIIIIAMIGIGIADASGLIGYAVQRAIKHAGTWQLTSTILLLGVLSNIVGSVGYIVLIPLACRAYIAAGRSPLAGLATAFAGVAGGTHATFFITTYDIVIAGISTSALNLLHPDLTVSPLANYYFLSASVILLVAVGTVVSIKFVEPRLSRSEHCNPQHLSLAPSTENDRALKVAGAVFISAIGLILFSSLSENGWLAPANPEQLARSEVIKGLPILVSFVFGLSGMVFGFVSGKFRREQDIIKACEQSLSQLGLFLLIMFFASQLIFTFKLSNLAGLLAVNLSDMLAVLSIEGPVLVIILVLFSAVLNIFMGSPVVQWSVMAPVFVPTLLLAGLPIELIQVAFRIGDSVTNIISPLFGYLGLILATAQQYQGHAKLGTLVSMMLPFSMAFLIMWTSLLVIWVYVLEWPLGI